LAKKVADGLALKYDLSKIYNGSQIKLKMDTQDYWNIKEAERLLNESEMRHYESKNKKWVVLVLWLIVGATFGFFIP
jgi:hypothetical protein